MPTIDDIKDGYFNYLVEEIFDTLFKADRYSCQDFEIVRLDLLLKLHKILESRQGLEEKVKILSLYEKR